jgi:hypothetical protein
MRTIRVMNPLHGLREWTLTVLEHWLGWVSGGILVLVIWAGELLKKRPIRPKAFAFLLVIGLLISAFSTWRDEHQRTENALREKAAALAQTNECDKDRIGKSALADGYSRQISDQRITLDRQQSSLDQCVVALGTASKPTPVRTHTTLTELSNPRLSFVNQTGKREKMWLALVTVNQPVSPFKGTLECGKAVSFVAETMAGNPTPFIVSHGAVSDHKCELGFLSPTWTEQSPLIFTLMTTGEDPGNCEFVLE